MVYRVINSKGNSIGAFPTKQEAINEAGENNEYQEGHEVKRIKIGDLTMVELVEIYNQHTSGNFIKKFPNKKIAIERTFQAVKEVDQIGISL